MMERIAYGIISIYSQTNKNQANYLQQQTNNKNKQMCKREHLHQNTIDCISLAKTKNEL